MPVARGFIRATKQPNPEDTMAHFYGILQGARGEASRLGHKTTGLTTTAASWEGAVQTRLYHGQDGHDYVVVSLIPWRGAGVERELFRGRVDGT